MADCFGCIYRYYEPDTNYQACKHPDNSEENPDTCLGEYTEADAKADAKNRDNDKY